MPSYEYGDMFSVYNTVDWFCFTANSTLNNDGELVMGAGIAKRVREQFPNIAKRFGDQLKSLGNTHWIPNLHTIGRESSPEWQEKGRRIPLGRGAAPSDAVIVEKRHAYGILVDPDTRVIAFQTKYHWRDDSTVRLIEYSTMQLKSFLLEECNGVHTVALNYPGIGHGQLKVSDVRGVVNTLPENVTIWRFK